jgi:hypothetical protein
LWLLGFIGSLTECLLHDLHARRRFLTSTVFVARLLLVRGVLLTILNLLRGLENDRERRFGCNQYAAGIAIRYMLLALI